MAERAWTPEEAIEANRFREALEASTPSAAVIFALMAINIAVYVVMVCSGVPALEPRTADLLKWGADFGPLTLDGDQWRIITAMFVHIGILHLAMNMYALFIIGPFTERLFGNVPYLVLYTVSGIGGGLASLAWKPLVVAAGASGAIFGVYGGLLGCLAVKKSGMSLRSVQSLTKNAALVLGINFVYGLAGTHVDLAAHIGGFATGFVTGCALATPLDTSFVSRLKRSGAVLAGGLIAASLIVPRLSIGDETKAEWYRLNLMSPSVMANAKDRVIYTSAASEQDAKKLGQVLVKLNYFRNTGAEAILWKDSRGMAVGLVLVKPVWNDSQVMAQLYMVRLTMAQLMGDPSLTLRLYDASGKLQKEIKPPDRKS